MAAASYFEQVQKIYIAFYQRPADPAGLLYWAQRIDVAGGDIDAVINAFADSAEAEALYGTIDSDSIGDVIDALYTAMFNRPADEAGKAWYIEQFEAGNITAGEIALAVLDGAKGDDAVAIANKVKVANEFTQQVDGRPLNSPDFGTGTSFNVTYDADDVEAAREILADVTSSPATVLNGSQVTEVLKDKIANPGDPIEGQIGGQTFMLTASVDNIVGTSGNDVINALPVKADGTAGSTLTAFDSIDGGAGVDTLNIYTTAAENTSFPANATVKNVEIVNIFNSGAAAAFGDASKFQGVEQLWQVGAAAAVTNLASTTTAGFRNITGATAALDVTAADSAASATVALDGVKDDAILTVKAGSAGVLNSVTVTGKVVDAAADGVAPIALKITAGKDVQTLAVNTAVDATLTVTDGAGKKVTTVDASASTAALDYDAATTVANIKTGSGNDEVTLKTALDATLKNASVSTGAGDDTIVVNVTAAAAGNTVVVDAGEGNDKIELSSIAANANYDVRAGAGDDVVVVTGTIKTTDKIDGGAGNDIISLAGKGTYVADDYIVLNKVITNFETLKLTGVAVGNLDASQLSSSYTTIDLFGGSTVTKVGTQALIANGNLTATAAGTNTAATPDKVYAGTLNITEKATGTITANADTVNLTVDASKGAVAATLAGFAKSANVDLVQALKADGSAFEGAATFVLDNGAVQTDLASLTLSGNGEANVMNANGTKLVTVDASGLDSVTFNGKAAAGLTYTSINKAVETIILGDGIDSVTLNASNYGAVDTVVGLNLVLNTAGTALDTATSDVLKVNGATLAEKFTSTHTDLDLLLKDAAASADDVLVFHFGGDTYVYADVGTSAGLIDADDVLVKLTGTIDLDALIVSLG